MLYHQVTRLRTLYFQVTNHLNVSSNVNNFDHSYFFLNHKTCRYASKEEVVTKNDHAHFILECYLD